MRITMEESLLGNLEGMLEGTPEYITKEHAYELLKCGSGQDFGYDVAAWEEWFKKSDDPLPYIYKCYIDQEEWERTYGYMNDNDSETE